MSPNPTACTCDTEDHTHDGGCPQYVPDPTSSEREQYIAAVMRLGHPRWEAADIAAAVMAVRDAELDRVRAALTARQEDIAFLERNTLPDLRRKAQAHEDGKKRWRTRAEKAEAENARLLAERQETNGKLAELTVALRAAEAERDGMERQRNTARGVSRQLLAKVTAARVERDELKRSADEAARLTRLLGDRDAEVERLRGRAEAAGEYYRRATEAEKRVAELEARPSRADTLREAADVADAHGRSVSSSEGHLARSVAYGIAVQLRRAAATHEADAAERGESR